MRLLALCGQLFHCFGSTSARWSRAHSQRMEIGKNNCYTESHKFAFCRAPQKYGLLHCVLGATEEESTRFYGPKRCRALKSPEPSCMQPSTTQPLPFPFRSFAYSSTLRRAETSFSPLLPIHSIVDRFAENADFVRFSLPFSRCRLGLLPHSCFWFYAFRNFRAKRLCHFRLMMQ